MIYDILQLKKLVKLDEVTSDNWIFKLHYKATVFLFFVFAVLVTARQLVGDPIDCFTYNSNLPKSWINNYCLIHPTFTIRDEHERPTVAPGVHQTKSDDPAKKYHGFYQFTSFVLMLQAGLFYLTHYIWKLGEGGKIFLIVNENDEKKLTEYVLTHLNHHGTYFALFVFCEVLNFVNVICQIILIDLFLDGQFISYGTNAIKYSQNKTEENPMIKVFPRVTKCSFSNFGSSGDVQIHDVLCILPLNVIYDKIYLFLWFWLIILSVITGLNLWYRFLIIFSRRMRYFVLKSRCRSDDVNEVVNNVKVSDWFIIYTIAKNIDCVLFERVILSGLATKFRHTV